jgi:hypothetical protein
LLGAWLEDVTGGVVTCGSQLGLDAAEAPRRWLDVARAATRRWSHPAGDRIQPGSAGEAVLGDSTADWPRPTAGSIGGDDESISTSSMARGDRRAQRARRGAVLHRETIELFQFLPQPRRVS